MLNHFNKNITRKSYFSQIKRLFSSSNDTLDIPTIDFDKFLNRREGWQNECKIVADCLYQTGILVVKDPRVNEEENTNFIKMMEKYYQRESLKYYAGENLEDAYPQDAYQHGVTPEYKEKAKSHCSRFAEYNAENRPISTCPPVFDSKWRFFWSVGERDKEVDEGMIVYPNNIPTGFPQWHNTMDGWGNKMLNACEIAAKMAAIGFNLPENTFSELMRYGAHLLAPTGSDLAKFEEGTIFAGVHYDLNFLTIHGKSNFGGLYIWLRNGTKVKVRVPDSCLLLQAGIQFEYLTGGNVLCGFHEVVYTNEVKELVKKIQEENRKLSPEQRRILWRISSTLFSHIRQNVMLQPIGHFMNEKSLKEYPPILTRDQVANELKDINLMI